MKTEENTTTPQATDIQIKEWKDKYGESNVFKLTIKDKVCYLKKPDLNVYSMMNAVSTTDSIKRGKVLLDNCWLSGNDIIRTDTDYFLNALVKVTSMNENMEAELEKL